MTRRGRDLDEDVLKAIARSASKFRQLYPVLLDANGEMIDGDHRKKIFKKLDTRTLPFIKTKKERLQVRLVANHARRGQTRSSWELSLRELAEILSREGVEQIGKRISSETGLPYRTIMRYLPQEFKDKSQSERRSHPRMPSGNQLEKETEMPEVKASAGSLVQSPAKIDAGEIHHEEQPKLPAREILEEYSKAVKDELPRIEVRNFSNQQWKAIILPREFYGKLEKACLESRLDMEEAITLALVKLLTDIRSKAKCLDKDE